MSKQEILHTIVETLKNYNPSKVSLFGSFARNENNLESDIDILVLFNHTYSLLQIIAIENELSDKLGIKVDLITEGAIKNNRIKRSIEKDLVTIYEA
jgi:predicted nucleotidyltransferase